MKKFFTILVAAVIIVGGAVLFFVGRGSFSGVPDKVEPYNESGFFYSRLDASGKKAYDIIMKEIYSFPKKIVINPLSEKELDSVFEAILYDNTDVFFLDDTCNMETEGTKTYFIPDYALSREDYEQKKSELDIAVNDIVAEALKIEDEFDREIFIHDTVIDRCSYINETGGDASCAYGCLVNGKSSCAGYSMAMKMIFDKCSLENHFAIGDTKNSDDETEGHIWNIVKINGSFYHVDATWDDNDDLKQSKYTYVNLTDEEICITHKAEERFLGECTQTKDNYFIRSSQYFTSFDEKTGNAISQKLAQYADNSENGVAFRFSDRELYEKVLKELFDNEEIYRLLVRANMLSKKELITDQVRYLCDNTHYIIRIVDYWK